jgi:hypothetical protein
LSLNILKLKFLLEDSSLLVKHVSHALDLVILVSHIRVQLLFTPSAGLLEISQLNLESLYFLSTSSLKLIHLPLHLIVLALAQHHVVLH